MESTGDEEVFEVSKKEDLNTRVHRSSSCKILFSELGIEMEPTKNTKPFISNVEGLLNRLEKALSFTEDSERKKEILNYIDKVKKGDKELIIKLEDPSGESYIGE